MQETKLTQRDGSPLPESWVGLRVNNKIVRRSFSQEFQDYLKDLDQWFGYLENFRHSLAHRIPLYIPPYGVHKDKEEAYLALNYKKTEAMERLNFAEYDRLFDEQTALGEFKPVMTHSFGEEAEVVPFHPQLLADFLTIEELGKKFLEELDRKSV